jgi:hypothetical protein
MNSERSWISIPIKIYIKNTTFNYKLQNDWQLRNELYKKISYHAKRMKKYDYICALKS